MDNISQTTPAHQLVSKETIPLISKPRSRGFFFGFAIFHNVFVLLLFFSSFSIAMFSCFLQMLATVVCAKRA